MDEITRLTKVLHTKYNLDMSNDIYSLEGNYVYYPDECKIESNEEIDILEIDIKSAGPTMVKKYFSKKYPELVKMVENEEDKIKRSIYISTTLSKEDYQLLRVYFKFHLLKFILSNFFLIDIIEIKSDGMLVAVYKTSIPNEKIVLYEDEGVKFKVRKLKKYLYLNNTSFYYYSSKNLILKGKYKYVPESIYMYYVGSEDYFKLKDIYSKLYYEILLKSRAFNLLEKYYICKTFDEENDKEYIKKNGKYEVFDRNTKNYNLKLFYLNPIEYFNTFVVKFRMYE